MSRNHLTFYCELDTPALTALLSDSSIVQELGALHAGVSLALQDFSAERAAAVQQLNRAGIPMIAWLLVPQAQGYFSHIGNAPESTARYQEFRSWTQTYGLQWEAVGLDIEPPLDELRQMTREPLPVLRLWASRLFDNERVLQGLNGYRELARRIRADGYRVESYQIPMIVDERQLGSTFLHHFMSLVDVPVDREVLMLYSSLIPPHGPGPLLIYGASAGAIAIGSTGGGIDEQPKLAWEEFCRDLRIARRLNDDIYVFSLEGCVQQGFLSRIKTINWDERVVVPLEEVEQAQRMRSAIRAILWTSMRPALLVAVPAMLILLRSLMARGRR
ncbi:MAG: hypothetical protein WCF84_01830 [Anaerolineae bacterium]